MDDVGSELNIWQVKKRLCSFGAYRKVNFLLTCINPTILI